jgi:hypothetical protein
VFAWPLQLLWKLRAPKPSPPRHRSEYRFPQSSVKTSERSGRSQNRAPELVGEVGATDDRQLQLAADPFPDSTVKVAANVVDLEVFDDYSVQSPRVRGWPVRQRHCQKIEGIHVHDNLDVARDCSSIVLVGRPLLFVSDESNSDCECMQLDSEQAQALFQQPRARPAP